MIEKKNPGGKRDGAAIEDEPGKANTVKQYNRYVTGDEKRERMEA